MNAPLPQPRRWLQVSLRALLAMTAGAALLCLGPIRIQQRSRTIDALQVAGAELVFNDPRLLTGSKLPWPICWLAGNDRRELLSVVIEGQGIEQLRRIALFPEIKLVVIVNGEQDLGSDDAEALGKLPNLQRLYIVQTGIGGGAIAGLSASQSLLEVQLQAVDVDDPLAEQLARLRRLEELELVHTGISKPAAERLKRRLPGVRLRIAPDP